MVQTGRYVHTLDGRIRLKSPVLKRAPQQAAEVERQFQECDGITTVTTKETLAFPETMTRRLQLIQAGNTAFNRNRERLR